MNKLYGLSGQKFLKKLHFIDRFSQIKRVSMIAACTDSMLLQCLAISNFSTFNLLLISTFFVIAGRWQHPWLLCSG